jgi:methyl-accepting chemotaxis protein
VTPIQDPRLAECISLCQDAAKGHLSSRILRVDDDEPYAELAHALNDMLDLVEATLRESTAALEATVDHRSWRRVMEVGMPGTYGAVARTSNRALDEVARTEAALTDVRAERVLVAGAFRGSVAAEVGEMVECSRAMSTGASAMSDLAAATLDRAKLLKEASEAAAADVQTVAAAAEQMSATIDELSRQANRAESASQTATAAATQAKGSMEALQGAAEDVSGVVKFIQNMAAQTNLLALNAAIEAARAGDAGRGFGVVAAEVKELARQTASAADDIGKRVGGMQQAATDGANHVTEVGSALTESADVVSAISAAIYEQSAATREIARSAEDASVRTEEAAAGLATIVEDAETVAHEAGGLQASSHQSTERIRHLDESVAGFVARISGESQA